MEPNNIEKQIREKLNSREIQPTSHAWDRLDAMLSVAEEKKTKRSFGWLYIAAAILVFVSVGMFLYNHEATIPASETVVGVEKDANSINKNTNLVETTPIEETTSDSEIINENPINNKQSVAVVPNTSNNPNKKSFTRGEAERSVANQNNQNNQKTNNPSTIINKEKSIEFQNSSDVALKNLPKVMETNKEVVIPKSTDTNQNTLAVTETKKPDNTSKVKINANSLLSEVDGELELTFREKVFKKVNKNYKEVKVALANRNNL